MLFRKRRKHNPQVRQGGGHKTTGQDQPTFFHIAYDMMLKGSVYMRKDGPVRQYCIIVGGLTRLVTSSDLVDRETYEALLAAGVIKPLPTRDNGDATPTEQGPAAPPAQTRG